MPYPHRLKNLQTLLKKENCDAFLVEDQTNLYYLTGMELSAGTLFVHTHGAHLIVDSRYVEACKKGCPFPVVLGNTSPLPQLLSSQDFDFVKTLGFNADSVTYSRYQELQKLVREIKQRKITLLELDNPVKVLRTIKDHDEIAALREAAILGSEGYDQVCSLLQEGITEAELAVELDIFWKKRGSKALAFDPIIAFGVNSSMPHYHVGSTKLRHGDTVLIDIGVNNGHYHSDMTRVVYFKKGDPKVLAIHSIVERAQKAALELCRPGTRIGDLDAAARGLIEAEGYGDNFTHSLGHGIGLDVHESPTLRNKPPHQNKILEEGMVITIEPGIYLPGIGGVRIEDTVVITANGHENLTNRPTSPKIIE